MLGSINHIALTVLDLEKSDKFWTPIFDFLKYKRILNSSTVSVWESKSTGSAINFWKAKESADYQYDAPGLHHVAFNAESTKQVDDLYALLETLHVKIVDSPKLYDEYESGYYAVFFKDMNGFKIELAYTPSILGTRK